ncbi:bifunctional 4-hydroxy-2-oxoglutarate aldolase/2-dehydro-3-deoxy-phosphogluconate aldolase [Pontibacter liquoris]|uniref:bifunctional 4-hydroxy-2-oxoglutarate aldolase/2-dehydro-3-deoxy-phosphogluconate aldolase n=1 Tax=Pontibacter liquoris TaxID=2905677 RepID=UPI001FA6DD88|nr:bifunctional 4-hydroxy-2-oxoglutarate aldolase/2-dehydro-3-deoxy-phosphogluconate aldolase [Pontibacter liquoris]
MATDKNQVLDQLLKTPVLPVYFHPDATECRAVLEACYAGGIRVFEFTDRGPEALDNFTLLKEDARTKYPDLKLGIGTIKTSARAEEFIAAGADFIVCPIMDAAIGRTVQQHGLLWVPGCMTPTEIAQAEKAGAPLVKLFPGNLLGTDFLKAIKPLFPGLLFMPTGGVAPTRASITEWFAAGVKAVGLGSKLFEHDATDDQHGHAWLSKRSTQVLQWATNGK